MDGVVEFRKSRRKGRKRSLLESPWLIPGLAAAALAGYLGSGSAPAVTGLMSNPSAAFTGSFGKCGSGMDRTCVVDGDTIRISGETIRMMDIDAPETRDYKCAEEKQRGDRATRRLVEILNAGKVGVIRKGGRDVDRYGRSLRVVLVDGRSVGGVLVSEGLARPWSGKRRPWC